MKTERYDLVVVGGGLAGMAAAVKTALAGMRVAVLDENPMAGGQLLRRHRAALPSENNAGRDKVRRLGLAYVEKLASRSIARHLLSEAAGIYDGKRVLLNRGGKDLLCLEGEFILLATGARERYLPFPGWTLPGVLSTGALQILLKSSGVLPSRHLALAGSGPLMLAAGYEALSAGARLEAILDRTPWLRKIPRPSELRGQGPKLREGARYLARLVGSGVPLHSGVGMVEARGAGSLEQLVVARLDGDGAPRPGSEFILDVPCLAMGNGFAPNIELALQAGCELSHDPARGGWVVRTGPYLETSLENVFAAGELTGVAGALKSLLEGELAGEAILTKAGRRLSERDRRNLVRLAARRRSHLRFGAYLNRQATIAPAALEAIHNRTVLCRCEDVTMGDMRLAVKEGHDSPLALKRALRLGMGRCQGRTCMPLIHDILGVMTGNPPGGMAPLSARPPVKPVPLGLFTEETE